MFLLYSILLTIGFLLMLPLFFLRREKYLAGFRQRLGELPQFKPNSQPLIWIHCVSVGETNAAVPLVKNIKAEFSDCRIVVSTTTKTGQDTAHKLFGEIADLIFYFPFDWKFSVRRTLEKIKPNVVLLMETEIWFNFIREARKSGSQIFIVNGRLSEKSANGYLKIRKTIRRVLHYIDLALVQTNSDANRFKRLGMNPNKIIITGNLKYDQPPIDDDDIFIYYFGERFDIQKKNPLIIAASTHSPEERWILEAFKKIHTSEAENPPRLLLVPRHPERFDEVAALVKKSGLKFVRRSSSMSSEDVSADVILLDSIGELRQIFPLAEIVFVGGSLIPHGGQNILEPALAEKAIITGFYTTNFADIVKTFEENQAVIRLPELNENEIPEKLAEVFTDLLQSEEKRQKLAKNAYLIFELNRGATEKTMNALRSVLQVQTRTILPLNGVRTPVKFEIPVSGE